ncbi:MAG: UDP-N-acetylglucosamine 2-epimerase (non-hydrolyzing) [Desulfovibrio sp.]|jgi:UDP-N-acetylglucosamine 2-epimerase (non-hydrolysing)|nr:UDP-N-acetylglucosamine 2-epimerase (non-hydrolyzing) [Desulfovibrio sp.]
MIKPRLKIVIIAGTRPEIIKIAPIVYELKKSSWANPVLITSGQHIDILRQHLKVFNLKPDIEVSTMKEGQSLSLLTSKLFSTLEGTIKKENPDVVLSQGDTTTVMTTACICFYLQIPFIHLEAGLRSNDIMNPFPEEFNRKVASLAASLHLAPTLSAKEALICEGIQKEKISVTGNTVIDALYYARKIASQCRYPYDKKNKLILLTAHRRENFGKPLEDIFNMLKVLIKERPDVELLYPVHPNPHVKNIAHTILGNQSRIHLVAPLDYLEFISALNNAYLVVSDSGGIQEEAPALRKPILVLRNVTERNEAITAGVAKLSGTDPMNIKKDIRILLDNELLYAQMAHGGSPFGDGLASARAVDALAAFLGVRERREMEDFRFQSQSRTA